MNRQEAEQLLLDFHANEEMQQYLQKLRTPSFFDIMGVSRNEGVHSRMLAWLLRENFHGIPMRGLMNIIARRMACQQHSPQADGKPQATPPYQCLPAILCGLSTVQVESVKTEVAIPSVGRRMDILVECAMGGEPYVIVIENKVLSREHDEQTAAYYDYINSKPEYQNRKKVCLYLTPLSCVDLDTASERGLVPECTCKAYVQICYQDIMDYILTPLAKAKNTDPRTATLVREYIACLGPTKTL